MTDQPDPPTLDPFPRGAADAGIAQDQVGNWLLRSMHPDDFARLQPFLVRVAPRNGDCLAEAGTPISSACFPEAGIAGFLDVLDDGRRLAVGLLGREGFVGWPLVMGNDRWPHEVMARGRDGTALRVDAAPLQAALSASPRLREMLLRYASTFFTQMSRTIVSNLIHPVEKRTARWLLLYHDRIDSDDLAITHDELSAMLGVRRASVTEALHQLEGCGGIRATRGRLAIRDRAALVALTSDTYGQAEAEYRRLIGEPLAEVAS
jgi:CRP-like cAMP-binding protein